MRLMFPIATTLWARWTPISNPVFSVSCDGWCIPITPFVRCNCRQTVQHSQSDELSCFGCVCISLMVFESRSWMQFVCRIWFNSPDAQSLWFVSTFWPFFLIDEDRCTKFLNNIYTINELIPPSLQGSVLKVMAICDIFMSSKRLWMLCGWVDGFNCFLFLFCVRVCVFVVDALISFRIYFNITSGSILYWDGFPEIRFVR